MVAVLPTNLDLVFSFFYLGKMVSWDDLSFLEGVGGGGLCISALWKLSLCGLLSPALLGCSVGCAWGLEFVTSLLKHYSYWNTEFGAYR